MYSKERPLRVFTTFSGYDSQCLALERLKEKHEGFDYELVGWSEIEPSAIKAHNLLFPMWADRNFRNKEINRKRRCLRLMDMDDRHIDTLIGARETMKNGKERQAISNSALYRLAGNSIVVNCMTLMFENLFYPQTEPTTGDQLKLF